MASLYCVHQYLSSSCFHSCFAGTVNELHYTLSTYGIPTLPINEDRNCRVDTHTKWLKYRKKLESTKSNKNVFVPKRFDVLFGRGKIVAEHSGNVRFGYLVDAHRTEYETSDEFGKIRIVNTILNSVHESNGRFLKRDDDANAWSEVDDNLASNKISLFFGNLGQNRQ